MKRQIRLIACATSISASTVALAQATHYSDLANLPFPGGYPAQKSVQPLQDEWLFQRAVQSYLWALPALNVYAMKEGSEKRFGAGYNVLPIFKQRLNAATLITTPNSDVIYALGYLDLAKDGPIVIEVPPGLQGILDDFFQRPICGPQTDGHTWCGDVGLPGPDKGKGGQYLLLPPGFKGDVPEGYFVYRPRTNGVFVFWRGFFKDPKQLEAPVSVLEQTKIYPLGQQASAKPMQFPDASGVPVDMLYPTDGSAFDMLKRFIDSEYPDPADMEMRGMLSSLGIVKGQPFTPDDRSKKILDEAARTAAKMARVVAVAPPANGAAPKYYPDRQYLNVFPGNADFTSPTFNYIDQRTGFFTFAYSASPGMAVNMVNVGAKYPVAFRDADGSLLMGENSYKLHLPPDIPAAIFWSVTAYDGWSGSGLNNGQPFPSINTMDQPSKNPDGSIDIYFGPTRPVGAQNYIRTIPRKGFFAIVRLYGPTQPFFDKVWKPDDLKKLSR
ncbi:DUF1254 domain-containing protein [Paraburkholderia bryophila]|jgi:hypothetical protein|uniref:DUF1254 domain-containing protein n=1 Tax=Paraburkholderia bryophila TaxID=420952 RepID=A0A329CHP8_9BURK|nr:DUF1254 domain-containing protein [Paraburkholderia bryophila]RAS33201.1 hypothetical protein BX591_107118 [Paraburkholderia bryophila]